MRRKAGEPRQPSENLRKNLRSLFNSIYYWANPEGVQPIGAFLEMPTITEAPNYNSLINVPICFNMIDSRLKGGYYWSETALLTDIMLMFANCRLYNQEAAQVYQDADTLEKVLLKRAEHLGLEVPSKPAITLVSKVKAKEFARAKKAARVKEVAGAKVERGCKAKADADAEELAAGEQLAANLEREVREVGAQEVDLRRKRRRDRAASKSLPASKRALLAEAKELEMEAKMMLPQSVESPRSIRRSSSTPSKGSVHEKIKELYNYLKDYTDPSCRVLSLPFMKLPSKSDYPDYYRVIKQPMDLQMISRNRRRYETLDEAVSDFTLVFDNAMRYNDDESLIYKDAKTLERAARHWRLDIESRSADVQETPSSSKGSPASATGSLEQNIKELYTFLKEYKDPAGRPLAFPYMKLPSKSEYPDYYEIIKQPLDLQMIFRNRRRYESLEEAISHFRLVFDNAMRYNMEESQIYLDAKVLDIATKSWQPAIMKDFNAQLPRMCG